jgi:hypothetical protein
VHRRQITFDALDRETGEVTVGRMESTPAAVERWVGRFGGREVHVALEACTGWLFVCDALRRAGAHSHLAEPVETSALRGRKRRAKTDRQDARWLRQLLCEGRLPEAWIPPEHVRQWRSRARLRKTLMDERTAWLQRIRATLFHHGVEGAPGDLHTAAGGGFLEALELPGDARERILVALAVILAGLPRAGEYPFLTQHLGEAPLRCPPSLSNRGTIRGHGCCGRVALGPRRAIRRYPGSSQ